MRQLTIAGRKITDADCFIIAEIGSNHGGDPDLCEKMIITAARCGVDAVKMQKRDNSLMFTKTALRKPYENEFSYGKTYGEHRDHLDWFGAREFLRFKAVAEKHGVIFFATPFEEESARFLRELDVPLWKIASCDVTNLPLVREVAGYQKPMLVSTGGASLADIDALVDAVDPFGQQAALLHCVSTYPNTDENVNLLAIRTMRQRYPRHLIGFSSHHPGILPLVIARTLGASIFEVHFTLNRASRGTDHGFSMEPKGLEQICNDLPRIQTMIGTGEKAPSDAERCGFVKKMGKGVYLRRPLKAGTVIEPTDICIKSPVGALKPHEADKIIGHPLLIDVSTGIDMSEDMVGRG